MLHYTTQSQHDTLQTPSQHNKTKQNKKRNKTTHNRLHPPKTQDTAIHNSHGSHHNAPRLPPQLLPIFVAALKDLVELQHGSIMVPCPLGFYRRACGQVRAGWEAGRVLGSAASWVQMRHWGWRGHGPAARY
eukprot:363080-Chlamydomonas_euryale.AAC.5